MVEKKNYNVLVLGVTGVGKSTWINSLANYFIFNDIETAVRSPPVCLIPQCFQYADNNLAQHSISVGDQSKINKTSNAASTTKVPQVYSFVHKNYCINFIDTPGVGDSAGGDTDETNVKSILDAISAFDELHGICILVKSNEAKLTPSYEYCLNELMKTLHKDAATNVMFIITNSRTDNYVPGNARALLKAYLDKLKAKNNITIPLIKDTMYCVDNETFRYQCIHAQNPDLLKGIRIENYAKSWNKSFAEARRFLKAIQHIKTYDISNCISVNEARTIIMFLIPPLTAINTIIQQNINNIEGNFDAMVDSLQKQLGINEYTIEVTKLTYPKTVCTAEKCIGVVKQHGYQTYYKQICHDHCYLRNISLITFPEEGLKNCAAIGDDDITCLRCGCDYRVHMHLDADQKTVMKQSKINDKLANLKTIDRNDAVASLKQISMDLLDEQETVNNSLDVFVRFLRQNAFYQYNSTYADYLALEIRNQEAIVANGGQSTILTKLQQKLNEFNLKTAKIDKISAGSRNEAEVNRNDIAAARDELFALEFYGAKIKEMYDLSSAANIKRLEHDSFVKHNITTEAFV